MATCGKCGGKRVVRCPTCKGGGKTYPLLGRPYACNHCRGSGKIVCPRCKGTGRV